MPSNRRPTPPFEMFSSDVGSHEDAIQTKMQQDESQRKEEVATATASDEPVSPLPNSPNTAMGHALPCVPKLSRVKSSPRASLVDFEDAKGITKHTEISSYPGIGPEVEEVHDIDLVRKRSHNAVLLETSFSEACSDSLSTEDKAPNTDARSTELEKAATIHFQTFESPFPRLQFPWHLIASGAHHHHPHQPSTLPNIDLRTFIMLCGTIIGLLFTLECVGNIIVNSASSWLNTTSAIQELQFFTPSRGLPPPAIGKGQMFMSTGATILASAQHPLNLPLCRGTLALSSPSPTSPDSALPLINALFEAAKHDANHGIFSSFGSADALADTLVDLLKKSIRSEASESGTRPGDDVEEKIEGLKEAEEGGTRESENDDGNTAEEEQCLLAMLHALEVVQRAEMLEVDSCVVGMPCEGWIVSGAVA